jgi:hypothetical protein
MLDAGIPMPAASASLPMPSYGEHIYLIKVNKWWLLAKLRLKYKKIYAGITGFYR